MSLSPRTRFFALKRDGFACRYCGRGEPDVQLHVDHIVPRAEGGTDDLGNLITSCSTCNLGKGTHQLVAVTPCHFCRQQTAGMFFEIPDGHLYVDENGRQARTTFGKAIRVLVCGPCLAKIVWEFPAVAAPAWVTCAACGTSHPNPEPGQLADLDEIVNGERAWVCEPCWTDIRKRIQ